MLAMFGDTPPAHNKASGHKFSYKYNTRQLINKLNVRFLKCKILTTNIHGKKSLNTGKPRGLLLIIMFRMFVTIDD